jgi:hypothetical protein
MTNAVTTWQNIPDDLADSIARPMVVPGQDNSRVIGGHLTLQGNQVTEAAVHRVTQSDLAPSRGGMLSTVQNNGGFHTANVTPDSTIEIPGFGRTSVKVAEKLGYLTRTGNGIYAEATPSGKSEESSTGGNLEGSNSGSQQQGDNGPELFDSDTEALLGDMVRGAPPGTYDSIMGSANALIAQGMDAETIAQKLGPRLAAATGQDPDVAAANIEIATFVWQEQADNAIKASGADPLEFFEWAKANRRDELQNAVNYHLFGRSTKAYRVLVNDYFDNTMPSEKALKAAGIPTKTAGGETMVKVKGSWMSLGSAVKAKLL